MTPEELGKTIRDLDQAAQCIMFAKKRLEAAGRGLTMATARDLETMVRQLADLLANELEEMARH